MERNPFINSKVSGVTLIELMIVLVVLSILVAIGYPAYQSSAVENRRTDGKKALLEIMNAQQLFYSKNDTYTTDLVSGGTIGLSLPDPNGDGKVPTDHGFYVVTASACGSPPIPITDCVLLTAEAQPGQTSDGDLSYNSRNQKMPVSKW